MDKLEEFVDCNLSNCYRISVLSEYGEGYGEEPNPLADFFGIGEGKGRDSSNDIDSGSGCGIGMGSMYRLNYLQKCLIK